MKRPKVIAYMPAYYDPDHYRSILVYARKNNWIVIAERPFERKPDRIQNFSSPIDGILTDALNGRTSVFLNQFVNAVDVPVVSLTDTSMVAPKVSCVVEDPLKVAKLALDYFLSFGLNRYVIWTYTKDNLSKTNVAFSSLLKRSQLSFRFHERSRLPRDKQGIWKHVSDNIYKTIKNVPRPLGFFCDHDKNAAEVVRSCQANGVSVPDGVRVVGVGNNDIQLAGLEREVVTVDLDLAEQATQACMMLDEMIDGKTTECERRLIRPKNVITYSVPTELTLDEQRVKDALEFINIHLCDGIQVNDLCFELGVSRSTLHNLFIEQLGVSPGDEIKRLQMEKAKNMLLNPHLMIETVAINCGFSSNKSLSKAFNRVFGMSPSQYRKENVS